MFHSEKDIHVRHQQTVALLLTTNQVFAPNLLALASLAILGILEIMISVGILASIAMVVALVRVVVPVILRVL